jgi:uncharacterized protein (DUF427 family)
VTPGPGQESVWDYPRPPRLEETGAHLSVRFGGVVVAETHRGKRVLETSHPPVYYFPPEDVRTELLRPSRRRASYCEFKGQARYFDLEVGKRAAAAAVWAFPDPVPAYTALRDHLAFYPGAMDACYVDGELVRAQEGDFYGGWITSRVVGPFKGGPGTMGW